MLKFTSIALGLLATAAIAQPSLAVNAANPSTNSALARPDEHLHAQLIIRVGDDRYRRDRYYWERERQERLARQRWEARQYRRWHRDRDYYRDRYDYRYYRRW
jgi:hypothetical protein